MLDIEISQAFSRYQFLINLLYEVNQKTDEALKNDSRWFAFAPKITTKFLNQAITLELLFSKKELEAREQQVKPFDDLSTIFATLRMQFETHGLFYHLFIPCDDMEENILRLRLWELDGVRSRVKTNASNGQMQSAKTSAYINYQKVIENSITS